MVLFFFYIYNGRNTERNNPNTKPPKLGRQKSDTSFLATCQHHATYKRFSQTITWFKSRLRRVLFKGFREF